MVSTIAAVAAALACCSAALAHGAGDAAAAATLTAHTLALKAAAGGFVDLAPNAGLQFRWGLACGPAAAPCRGVRQRAYRLAITRAPASQRAAAGEVLWSSGVVEAGSPFAFADVAPHLLPPDSRFVATVTVWGSGPSGAANANAGAGAGSTATAEFRTALRDADQAGSWEGDWISGGTQLRGSFELPHGKAVATAHAYASGVGCFDMSINAKNVTDSYLNPGFSTVPSWRLLYRAFDVAPLLTSGGLQVAGVRLGQCKYGYLQSYCTPADAWQPWCRAFILQLNVKFTVGSQQNFTTSAGADSTWMATTEANPVSLPRVPTALLRTAMSQPARPSAPAGLARAQRGVPHPACSSGKAGFARIAARPPSCRPTSV